MNIVIVDLDVWVLVVGICSLLLLTFSNLST